MLGRRQTLVIAAAMVVASVIGGWIWSAASEDPDSQIPELVLTSSTAPQTIPTNKPNEGEVLPVVDLENAQGEKISTESLLAKPLILNFWFSTCEPCKREMPVLQKVHEATKDEIEFVGVNPQDNPEGAEKFAAKYGVDYQLLLDRNGVLVSKVGISTFPTTLFVNQDGQVILQYAGEVTESKLLELIDEAFGIS